MRIIMLLALFASSSVFASTFSQAITGIAAGHQWARSGWPSGQYISLDTLVLDKSGSMKIERIKLPGMLKKQAYIPSSADMAASDWIQKQ